MVSPDHLVGGDAYDVAWSAESADDGFDEAALEQAMLKARQDAYRALGDLDAASSGPPGLRPIGPADGVFSPAPSSPDRNAA